MQSICPGDRSFGPAVVGCRNDFDFSITFEETILSIVPSGLFILIAAWRLHTLTSYQKLIRGHAIRYLKSASLLALVALESTTLALVAQQLPRDEAGDKVTAAAVLTILATLLLLVISNLEHSRSLRASVLISLYLVPTVLFDIARARTWWLAFGGLSCTVSFTIKTIFKFCIAVLEAVPKKRWLEDDQKQKGISPEETSGVYSLAFLWWLNPLIYLGSRKVLDSDDLYPLDTQLSSNNPLPGFRKMHEPFNDNANSISILFRLVRTAGLALLAPVPARLLLIGFSFCQPFFIQTLTRFLQGDGTLDNNTGAGLIGASILIYSGLSLSASMYWYYHYRLLTRLRATLGTIVFDKSLHLSEVDDSVLTVMSLDINRVYGGLHNIHELWANTLEVALAAWLLQRQLGAAFAAPIVVVVVCVGLTTGVGKYAGKWQGDWSDKTQGRVKLTSGIITQIKEVKLSGRAEQMVALAHRLREDELNSGSRFRLLGVFSTCVAFAPMLLAPVITFAVTDIGRPLDTSQVYVSLAYLTLLASPLSQLFQTVPMMLASTASFRRIRDFLAQPCRGVYDVAPPVVDEEGVEESFSFQDACLGWQEGRWTLSNLNLAFLESQLSIIIGPVASGKSTICKSILGEVPFVGGTIRTGAACHEKVGFCDQAAFLTHDSIRANVIGPEPFDAARYESILRATLLDVDIASFPERDGTQIGSKGMALSGGQKQRVALARALYLDAKIYVLDDALSGLDIKTADAVVQSLFGPQGLLRDKTVIWCTHSTKYLSLAQQVIVLGKEGMVQRCGPPDPQTFDLTEASAPGSIELDAQSSTHGSPPGQPPATTAVVTNPETNILRSRHDSQVYALYLRALGPGIMVLVVATGVLFGFSWSFGTIWVGFWTRNTFDRPASDSRSFYLGLYAVFQVFGVVALAMYCSSTQLLMSRRGGSQLHARAIRHLFSLPLSYFGTVDSGVTTNLFSQDMGMLDNNLTFAISNTFLSGFTVVGQLVVVAVATPFVAVGYPLIFGVLYVLQNYYLRTSRQLRLLDLEAKSPLYESSKFQEVATGLISIRAFKWAGDYQRSYGLLLDKSLQPDYLLDLVQQWLSLSLNLISGIIAVAVTCFATQISSTSHAGLVGAGLVSLMTLSDLICATVRSWVQLETSLGAVKRLKDFEGIGPEKKHGNEMHPPDGWPSSGRVEISGVSAGYGDAREKPNALQDVRLSIMGGEKVAIVGRTGSGKSSLLLLLMRLLDPAPETAEKLTIDGIQLQQLDRETLRRRIIAVPQETIFLAGEETFKELLDPYGKLSVEQCETALAEVGLQDAVDGMGGLHAPVAKDALSHGQKQLLGLAIAIGRKMHRDQTAALETAEKKSRVEGGVLLLDEVTSSVDPETEKNMQLVIFRVFSEYTVISVTHQLRFLDRYDAVYSMSNGELTKFGNVDN
ncbi:putative ABC multidrug transporter [Truncatella angustata]|uniref:ABC multidrug transporter n=1 Tax=Truncatella angustata TaxID=152316 RepID=A0A9P8UHG2_9PEZI|nr:putative ABC multidrug transporter [Truncatella angustata]KAH6652223.1 putative ABC multidrug transporter [Truncatella angustata]